MMTRTRGVHRFPLLTGVLLGIGLVPAVSQAQVVTQNPSAFDITVDGFFTDVQEWSDVTPITFNSGQSFTYTAVDPGKDALYLMYDELSSTTAFGSKDLSGPVSFNVGLPPPNGTGHHYDVYFNGGGIICQQDHLFLNVEGIMKGARSFGTSPNSSTPHNMLELEVSFDCSDPTLGCHIDNPGVYSPAPSHWGATVSNGPVPVRCVKASSDSCDSAAPQDVPCNTAGAIQVFGPIVSNACVKVEPGTGGVTEITKIPLPGEAAVPDTRMIPAFSVWPNPAFGGVWFSATPGRTGGKFEVLDLTGRRLWSVPVGSSEARVRWNGATRSGVRAGAGVYVVRFLTEGKVTALRFIWLR